MKIKVTTYDLDKKEENWAAKEEEIEVSDEFADRHSELCMVCGWPDYPDCRKWCQNGGEKLRKTVIDENKIKGKLALTEEEWEEATIRVYYD